MEFIQESVRWRAVLFAVLNFKFLIQNGERTIVDDTAWNTLA